MAYPLVEDERAGRLQFPEHDAELPVVAGPGDVHDPGHRDGPAGLGVLEPDDRCLQHAAPYAQGPLLRRPDPRRQGNAAHAGEANPAAPEPGAARLTPASAGSRWPISITS